MFSISGSSEADELDGRGIGFPDKRKVWSVRFSASHRRDAMFLYHVPSQMFPTCIIHPTHGTREGSDAHVIVHMCL